MDRRYSGKELLASMKEMDKLIEQIREQIRAEESKLTDTSVHYKEVQVQASCAKDKMFEKMPEIADMQKQLREYKEELLIKKQSVLNLLKKMEPVHQRVIMFYYMQGLTIEQTAVRMDKSYTWTWWELKAAVEEFEHYMRKEREVKQ